MSHTQSYSVIVPRNTFPGDIIVIEVEGEEYEILVPEGTSPGDELQVELPVARQSQSQKRRSTNSRRGQQEKAQQQQRRRQQQQQQQQQHTTSRSGRSESRRETNHPIRSVPPPIEPLWLDVSLVAGDDLAIGQWANVHIFELRGREWVRCTSKALWEQVTHPSSVIRISPVPEANRFLVKVSGDKLEPTSLEVSPNTHVQIPVVSINARRQHEEAAAYVEQRASTQQRQQEQRQQRHPHHSEQQQRPSQQQPPHQHHPTPLPVNPSNMPLPRRMSRLYSQESTARIDVLTILSTKVDLIASKINGFEKSVREGTASGAQLSTIQDALSQCYGNLEHLQFTEIDAVMTGDLTTGKDQARQLRKNLSKRTGALLNIVEGLVNEIKQRKSAAQKR